jgi:hypothetical protein
VLRRFFSDGLWSGCLSNPSSQFPFLPVMSVKKCNVILFVFHVLLSNVALSGVPMLWCVCQPRRAARRGGHGS